MPFFTSSIGTAVSGDALNDLICPSPHLVLD